MRHVVLVVLLTLLAIPAGARADDRPGLVVIAPAAWEADLAPYVELRRQAFDVRVAALEDVLRTVEGVDAPERVKRFLWRGWRDHGVRYALLVGDSDTFPVRWMVLDRVHAPAFHTAFYASDHYYADVARDDGSFDDWNAATDGHHAGYFGEVTGEHGKAGPINLDRVSYVPEVAVGRWPVSTRDDLRAVIAKTVAWEARAVGPRRALLVHMGGWVDARGAYGAWADTLAGAGWSVERRLFGEGGEPKPAEVVAALKGGVELAFHAGHGSDETWHGCLGPRERAALAGAPTAVMFSVGCGTAVFSTQPPYEPYLDVHGLLQRGTNAGQVFTEPPPPPAALQPGRLDATGLGERLVRMPSGGAVAYIGCNTGAQPCALTLQEGFTAAVAGGARRLGDAWNAALAHYWRAQRLADLKPDAGWYPPSVFFQGMKFMVFGDPALPLPAAGAE